MEKGEIQCTLYRKGVGAVPVVFPVVCHHIAAGQCALPGTCLYA